jgi:hypothetical protein
LLTTVIRFYGDSLQGIIGSYLERSIQVFSEQQQQLRGQIGNLVVQAPRSLLNQLAERNMEIWKGLQQGIKSGLSATAERPDENKSRPVRKASPANDRPACAITGGIGASAPTASPARDTGCWPATSRAAEIVWPFRGPPWPARTCISKRPMSVG